MVILLNLGIEEKTYYKERPKISIRRMVKEARSINLENKDHKYD